MELPDTFLEQFFSLLYDYGLKVLKFLLVESRIAKANRRLFSKLC